MHINFQYLLDIRYCIFKMMVLCVICHLLLANTIEKSDMKNASYIKVSRRSLLCFGCNNELCKGKENCTVLFPELKRLLNYACNPQLFLKSRYDFPAKCCSHCSN